MFNYETIRPQNKQMLMTIRTEIVKRKFTKYLQR